MRVGGRTVSAERSQAIQDLATALQNYGTGDLGLIAYESAAVDGMILGEEIIVEILRPGDHDPVAEGEVGEVVVTNLDPAYPLILCHRRHVGGAAGDQPVGAPIPASRMGRADQTTKVRGMFVHPGQINDVLKRHGEVIKGRTSTAPTAATVWC